MKDELNKVTYETHLGNFKLSVSYITTRPITKSLHASRANFVLAFGLAPTIDYLRDVFAH